MPILFVVVIPIGRHCHRICAVLIEKCLIFCCNTSFFDYTSHHVALFKTENILANKVYCFDSLRLWRGLNIILIHRRWNVVNGDCTVLYFMCILKMQCFNNTVKSSILVGIVYLYYLPFVFGASSTQFNGMLEQYWLDRNHWIAIIPNKMYNRGLIKAKRLICHYHRQSSFQKY